MKRRITVLIQDRYTVETDVVTGAQIKELASIPPGFSLHRRVQGGNEPIRDDQSVEVHDGDHFFARPPSDVSHVR
ncbi:MAG: multiubiquitin domain-containing protein [Chloroflexi bacterium]|nr:multiubiquitin domain-containing protein [Chloroflexota bacterium]